MKARELYNLGLHRPQVDLAQTACRLAAQSGMPKSQIRKRVRAIVEDQKAWEADPIFGDFAKSCAQPIYDERLVPAPWTMWGEDLDQGAITQMENACKLPVAHRGALMPDAHLGYGLPIGGVLATEGAVIPYAVGVDIACRMRLSILDVPVAALGKPTERRHLIDTLEAETRFGMGANFTRPRDHEVMDEDWGITPITQHNRQRGRSQLGSSGSGNHFVEYGVVTLDRPELGLAPGEYVAILSHSGSRGAGAAVANTYSTLARQLHPELPGELAHLAWLDLDGEPGQEYWAAMELMGKYAAANHEVIHREMVKTLGAKALAVVENHHNFAWKEVHDGKEVVVHRKGATPAGKGVLGIIPGSMSAPAFVVRGLGKESSLRSASHGAGRAMSRRQAQRQMDWTRIQAHLDEQGVELLSAGLDEAPFAYKDIHKVMASQQDLVEVIARFEPKIVKMAPPGHRAED